MKRSVEIYRNDNVNPEYREVNVDELVHVLTKKQDDHSIIVHLAANASYSIGVSLYGTILWYRFGDNVQSTGVDDASQAASLFFLLTTDYAL